MVWPPDIDPAKRERHLQPNEFAAVFGITREAFEVMRPFEQLRMKKAHGLF